MAKYDNTNSGALFINERRQKDSQPNYTGTINVDGVEYWVSGWKKTSQTSGKFFLSLALKPKDAQAQPRQETSNHTEDFDDDIPF